MDRKCLQDIRYSRARTHLPSFNGHAYTLAEKDDITCIIVVIEKIEQNNKLNEDIGDDLRITQFVLLASIFSGIDYYLTVLSSFISIRQELYQT